MESLSFFHFIEDIYLLNLLELLARWLQVEARQDIKLSQFRKELMFLLLSLNFDEYREYLILMFSLPNRAFYPHSLAHLGSTPSSSLYQNGVRESWEEAQEQVPNIMISRDTGIPNILSLLGIIGRLERSNTGHMLVGV